MIADIHSILWKEWKEILTQRGSLRGGLSGILIFVGVMGVFLPLSSGAEWVKSPASLIIWAWLPFLLVGGTIADAIAGERERHTLETLLASRLSDQSILFGKIAAAVGYAWGLTLLTLLLSLVTVNVAFSDDGLLLYSPGFSLAAVGFSLLISLLSAGVGIIISLRAVSVRQAYQKMSIGFMMLFLPLLVVGQFLPDEWKVRLAKALVQLNLTQLSLVLAVVLICVDSLLLYIAKMRFRRARLILD